MRSLNIEDLKREIKKWIRQYIESANADGIVVGLSGGIDSAVTAFLSAEAIGKKNVIGVSLPCESSQKDIQDAELVANTLGIEFLKINLKTTYESFLNATESLIETNQLARANIKPRLRMTMLYFIGQSRGTYLVAGTGNRTEIAIGYFTKYGDGGVDFEPIGALYKCEVESLATSLKVPDKIIERPPSAGLWEGQTDEEEIGIVYDLLDEIIYRLDYGLDLDEFDSKKVEKVKRMFEYSKHKRKMPPLFKIED
ncbi:MAG: NAD+ synthase [Promethearchaeota archaeon]|nr:MAG: NAD+ synthase [Candidatus Lokiarchaeota archaeon]